MTKNAPMKQTKNISALDLLFVLNWRMKWRKVIHFIFEGTIIFYIKDIMKCGTYMPGFNDNKIKYT